MSRILTVGLRLRRHWRLLAAGVVGVLILLLPAVAQAADPAPLRTVSDPNPDFSGVWVDTVNNELIVGDDNHHAAFVYSRTATGPAAPLRTIKGLSSLLDYPSSLVVDTTNNELWAVNDDTSDRAVVYSRTANGDVAPLRVVDFKALQLTEKRTWGWSVDSLNDEVAGTFQNGSTVDFFSRIGGDLLRSISGPATGLADPHGIFIDSANNEVFVVNEGHVFGAPPQAPSITVFARTASGNAAPLRTIQGPSTGLSLPRPISVDTVNNELAVANGDANSITVYSRTASGNVAPLRTISGPTTGLSNPTGVFIDAVNNEIVVANWANHSITVYPRTQNGDGAPLRTITAGAGAATGLGNPGAVSLDLTDGEFGVTNCVSHPRIAFFPRLANGQAGPVRVIEGQKTRISRSLHGIAIDPVNNEVLVPSTLEDAILVFGRTASGNVPPLRVIQGAQTGVNKPQGIAIDTLNNEIALANEATPSITVYARTASGNVAPLRTITDPANLSKPVGIWIDNVNNEIVVADGGSPDVGLNDRVITYPRLASGPTTPLRVITGAATLLNKVRQVAVDTTNNEIVVASQGNRDLNPPVFGDVAVFDRLANGNVAPKRFLQHVNASFVEHPRSVWVDAVNNEIGVGDSKLNEIRVFPRQF
jgi:6-phosphogluconolactonase (cycloisomerase 2 family)